MVPQYCIDGTVKDTTVEEPGKSHMIIVIIVLLVSVSLVVLLVMLVYKKCIKKEITTDMTSRVGELVAHYANKVSKQKIRQNEKFIEAHDEEL